MKIYILIFSLLFSICGISQSKGELQKLASNKSNQPFYHISKNLTLKTSGSYLAKMTGSRTYSKDSMGVFQPSSKSELTYDSNDLSIQNLNYTWDGMAHKLSNSDTSVYNSNGDLILYELFQYSNNQKTPSQRITTTYNTSGLKDKELTEVWNGNNYDTNYLAVYHYSVNVLDSLQEFINQSGSFYLAGTSKYYYNGGQLIKGEDYTHSFGTTYLSNYSEYTYLSNGLLHKELQFRIYDNFDTSSVEEHFYDANSNDTLIYTEYRDSVLGLQPGRRVRTSFDSNGNEGIQHIHYYVNNQWVLWFRSEVGVDPSISIADVLVPYRYTIGFLGIANKPDWITYYLDYGVYSLNDSLVYDYDVYIGIDEKKENLIQLGPNPFSDYLNITIHQPTKATIFSLSGEVVSRKKLTAGKQKWEIQNIEKGIYILQLEQNDRRRVVKLVKH